MLNLLRDNIWQFIGVLISSILGIISLVITSVLYVKQLRHKVMIFSIVENVPVIHFENVSASIEKNVKIQYHGTDPPSNVKEMYSIVLKVSNAGNATITKGDYEENSSLIFEFAPDTKILEAKLIDKSPALEVSIKPDTTVGRVSLKPFRLKSKESFKIKVLIDKFNDINTIHGIDCFNDVDFRTSNEEPERSNRLLLRLLDIFRNATFILCIIVSIVIIYNINSSTNVDVVQYAVVMGIIAIIFIMIFFASKLIRNFLENQNKE